MPTAFPGNSGPTAVDGPREWREQVLGRLLAHLQGDLQFPVRIGAARRTASDPFDRHGIAVGASAADMNGALSSAPEGVRGDLVLGAVSGLKGRRGHHPILPSFVDWLTVYGTGTTDVSNRPVDGRWSGDADTGVAE